MNPTDNQNVSAIASDGLRPLPFREWSAEFESGGRIATYDEYQTYVRRWTEDRIAEQTAADKVRSDYIDMLKSIYVYLDEDARKRFEQDIRWDSQLDLARVIPMFARKIRDIIRYFADKRESVIRSKLKYNMHGSFLSLERMLHEYLLSNYTRRRHYERGAAAVDSDGLPDLYDVNTKFHAKIREYYDSENYFDKSPDIAVSAYFPGMFVASGGDVWDIPASGIYEGWDLSKPDEVDWLFGGGYKEGRKIDNPMYDAVYRAVLETSGLSGEDMDNAANKYVFEMTKRYLGNNLVLVSGGYYYPPKMECRYEFSEGNNWFYFPSGVVQSDAGIVEVPPISIHDTTLAEFGTGGGSYDTADRIFVRRGTNVEGAWLKQPKYTHDVSAIDGVFQGGYPTQFRYPFLGYGISAEGMEWSGPTLTNRNQQYELLSETEKVAVQRAYWKSPRPDFDCDALDIQDLGLDSASGSTPASAFQLADHLSIRSASEADGSTVYANEIFQYWLYRPTTTEIPVSDSGRTEFAFPNESMSKCDNVPVSLVGGDAAVGAVCGACPNMSDILYKVDSEGNYYDAAWLSGRPVVSGTWYFDANGLGVPFSNIDGVFEADGFSIVINPGEDYAFMWTGGGEPFGDVFFDHPGFPEFSPKKYVEGDADYDYVYQDAMFPYGTDVEDARAYGYRLGASGWESPSAEESILGPAFIRNCVYRYHRAADAGTLRVIHRYLDVKHPPVWKKMHRDTNGVWTGSDEDSDMVLRPGEHFVYSRPDDGIAKIEVEVCAPPLNPDVEPECASACGTFDVRRGPFALRVPISGCKPYWTSAQNVDGDFDRKSVDVYHRALRVEGGIPLYVPQPVEVVVNPWDVLTYFPVGMVSWRKEIGFSTPSDEIRWKKLSAIYVDNLFEGVREDAGQLTVVSAVQTDEDSDIMFSYVPGDVVLVNYVAVSDFVWEQEYSCILAEDNIVSGYALSPESRAVVLEAQYPHANMVNRHYPSYAIAANPSTLFTEEDVGGYFVPSRLGVSVALSKDTSVALDRWGRGPSGMSLFSEGDKFAEDQGFTMEEQNIGLSVSAEDEMWTRVSPYPVANAGMRRGNEKIQSFVPYLTEEENRGTENKGVTRADDAVEPWLHDGGDSWNPYFAAQGFVPHITRQEPTKRWADSRLERGDVSKICSDMNGVQFALLKPPGSNTIYDERGAVGPVVYRAYDDFVHGICDLGSTLSGIRALRNGWVYDIDCARNVFFARCRTPDGIGLPRIDVPLLKTADAANAKKVWEWYCDKIRPSFARRFSVMAQMYGVSEFEEIVPEDFIDHTSYERVGDGIRNDVKTFFDALERHYIGVSNEREFFVDAVENTWLHEDAIRSAMNRFDGRLWYSTIYRTFAYLADALNGSLPFEPSLETVVSIGVFTKALDNGRNEVYTTVDSVNVETVRGGGSAPGWHMNRERRYVVPLLHETASGSVPEFVVVGLDSFGVEHRECSVGELSGIAGVNKSVASAVGAGANRYRPVCSYNDETNTVSVVRQVSGTESEIGAFEVFTYDMVDDRIGGYAIVPQDTNSDFAEYVATHIPAIPSSTSGESWGDKTSFAVSSFSAYRIDENNHYQLVEESYLGVDYILKGSYFTPRTGEVETAVSSVAAWINMNESSGSDREIDIDFRYDAITGDMATAPRMELRKYELSLNRMDGTRPSYVPVVATSSIKASDVDAISRHPDGFVWYNMADAERVPTGGSGITVTGNLNFYLSAQ